MYYNTVMNPLSDVNILIIDDDRDDHYFFTSALNDLCGSGLTLGRNFKITSVYDGVEGIDVLLERGKYKHSILPRLDFIVLDLFMPLSDGYEVLGKIREQPRLKSIPVYVLTSSEPETHKRCLALGCTGFFSKPPDLAELRMVILEMMKPFC